MSTSHSNDVQPPWNLPRGQRGGEADPDLLTPSPGLHQPGNRTLMLNCHTHQPSHVTNICTHVHTQCNIPDHPSTHVCTLLYILIFMQANTHTLTLTHTLTHTHAHAHTHTHMHTHAHTNAHTYMRMHTHTHFHLPQVRSLGVLLKYVDKKRLGVELEDSGTRVPILAIQTFSL